jgi:alkaline phosphatase D
MEKSYRAFVIAFAIFNAIVVFSQKNKNIDTRDTLYWTIGQVGIRDAKVFVLRKGFSNTQMTPAIIMAKFFEGDKYLDSYILTLDQKYGHSTIAEFHELKPNTQYWIKTMDIFQRVNDSISFTTQPLWKYRTNAPDLDIAFGSCAYLNDVPYDRPGKSYGGGEEIFNSIAKAQPDAMIWLGDNVYFREGDWDSQEGMIARYIQSRTHPRLDSIFRMVPNYAIWDDHDFGPNDSNGSFILKDKSLETFAHFWPNPTVGIPGQKGITSMTTIGDVDIFFLDNRYHRVPKDLVTRPYLSVQHGQTILGQEQISWLIQAIKTSQASFKVICIGGQFINSAAVYENYSNYAEERAYIRDLLVMNKIKNVIFLSGDRHCGEISKLTDTDFVTYDLTSSPLTSGAGDMTAEKNEFRMEGTVVPQRHFAQLHVRGENKNRKLSVSYHDTFGKIIFEKELNFDAKK